MLWRSLRYCDDSAFMLAMRVLGRAQYTYLSVGFCGWSRPDGIRLTSSPRSVVRDRERASRSMIALEAPGWRGRRGPEGIILDGCDRGPEPATKHAGMDPPRARASSSFAVPGGRCGADADEPKEPVLRRRCRGQRHSRAGAHADGSPREHPATAT